jgi:hypothetical protein
VVDRTTINPSTREESPASGAQHYEKINAPKKPKIATKIIKLTNQKKQNYINRPAVWSIPAKIPSKINTGQTRIDRPDG